MHSTTGTGYQTAQQHHLELIVASLLALVDLVVALLAFLALLTLIVFILLILFLLILAIFLSHVGLVLFRHLHRGTGLFVQELDQRGKVAATLVVLALDSHRERTAIPHR